MTLEYTVTATFNHSGNNSLSLSLFQLIYKYIYLYIYNVIVWSKCYNNNDSVHVTCTRTAYKTLHQPTNHAKASMSVTFCLSGQYATIIHTHKYNQRLSNQSHSTNIHKTGSPHTHIQYVQAHVLIATKLLTCGLAGWLAGCLVSS